MVIEDLREFVARQPDHDISHLGLYLPSQPNATYIFWILNCREIALTENDEEQMWIIVGSPDGSGVMGVWRKMDTPIFLLLSKQNKE